MVITIKTFGQRVKIAWNNIYELEEHLKQTKLPRKEIRDN